MRQIKVMSHACGMFLPGHVVWCTLGITAIPDSNMKALDMLPEEENCLAVSRMLMLQRACKYRNGCVSFRLSTVEPYRDFVVETFLH